MNMFKKNGGFTLVELIVVIAILAILAGIAVPAYSGYISKANEAADLTLLDSVKTAATFAAMEKNAEAVVTKITVNHGGAANSIAVVCTVPAGADAITAVNVAEYVGDTIEFKSNNATATWYKEDPAGDETQGWNFSGTRN